MKTVKDARLSFLRDAGLPDDGNDSTWLDWLWVGPIGIPVPNIPARRAVLPYHDLSHMMSGYGTDWRGEFQESAYEVASGCKGWLAWTINLQGFAAGLMMQPFATVSAWRRGAGSGSVYGRDLNTLMHLDVEELRTLIQVADAPLPWTPLLRRRFAVHVLGAFASGLPVLAIGGAVVALLWRVGVGMA